MGLKATYISSEREIFKVQVPVVTTEPVPLALIYNQARTVEFLTPVTPDLETRMQGRLKAFFYGAEVAGIFAWGDEAPWQDW